MTRQKNSDEKSGGGPCSEGLKGEEEPLLSWGFQVCSIVLIPKKNPLKN